MELELKKFLYFILVIIYYNFCYGGCSCGDNGVKKNKFDFLNGTLRLDDAIKSKSETSNLIKKMNNVISGTMGNLTIKVEKIVLNNANKVSYYMNFTNINYILELLINFVKRYKDEYPQEVKGFINFSDNLMVKVFNETVKKGEELSGNDLLIKIREKCNKMFSVRLTDHNSDCLTGFTPKPKS